MSRESSALAPGASGSRSLPRLWPWRASLIAAVIVDLVIGGVRRFDFAGIEGFSTTNYGWLAFSLVGGIGLAWRLAKQPARRWLLVRPLVAPTLSFVACFVAVAAMGLVFLPDQPLTETLTTDAPGRAGWLSLAVLICSCICEAVWILIRRVRRHGQS